jgi:hypothetical protein
MQRTLQLCLLAGAMSLCLVKGAASPIVGTWESFEDGRKSATVRIQETDGILGGTLVVYIVHDNGTGEHDGDASAPMPLAGTTWDGRALRFSVNAPGRDKTVFELRLTGGGKGELKCTGPHRPAAVFPVTRAK